MIKLLLTIILITSLVFANNLSDCYSQCPPGYAYCAEEGGNCKATATFGRMGFISYGVCGRYTYTPFTIDDQNIHFQIKCDNRLGDIYWGHRKYCCYTTVSWAWEFLNGINGETFPYMIDGTFYAQGATIRSKGSTTAYAYGKHPFWTYRFSLQPPSIKCDDSYFGDPYYGKKKICQGLTGTPANFYYDTYREYDMYCASEGHVCKYGYTGNKMYWAKYGSSGHYYTRIVSTWDGSFSCDNGLFGDPFPGGRKSCYLGQVYSEFNDEDIYNDTLYEDIYNDTVYNSSACVCTQESNKNIQWNMMLYLFCGCTLLFVLIGILFCYLRRRKSKKKNDPLMMINSDGVFRNLK